MRVGLGKVIIIGVIVRLILSLYTQQPATYAKFTYFDQLFILGSNPLVRGSSFGPSFYIFYTPFYLTYWSLSSLGINYDFVLNALFKVPPLLGDLIIAFALYRIGYLITGKTEKASFLAAVYFLNPYSIWITSLIGHAESIWVGFVLLAITYIANGKTMKGAATLGLATMFRLLPLLLVPFFLYFMYRRRLDSKRFLVVYGLVTVALAAPYIVSFFQIYSISPYLASGFLSHFVGSNSAVGGTLGYGIESIKTFAYNFTGVIASLGYWPTISSLFGFLSFLPALIIFVVYAVRRGDGGVLWLSRSILTTYALLLIFTPLVQQEYFSWILPFLLIELVISDGLPHFLPKVLTVTWLLIDPITQGGFFYYTFVTLLSAPVLVATWPFNTTLIYIPISALNGLLILVTVIYGVRLVSQSRGDGG